MSSLYDILQVSPEASQDIIRTTYQRLAAAIRDDQPDADMRRKALNEAFFTLSSPERRQRYDQRLNGSSLVVYADAPATEGRPIIKYLVLGVVLIAAIVGYTRYNHTQEMARLERERIAAEQKRLELETRQAAIALQQEREQRNAELYQANAERAAERQQQLALERTRREADNTMRANAAADERARREAERQQQAAERQQQQAQQNEVRAAQQRLEREKALARQMEYENSRNRRLPPY